MKYMYLFDGGGYVTATDATEFVDAMRSDSRAPSTSRLQFMVDVSNRCNVFNGSCISSSDDHKFLEDLIANGFVTELKVS
jgi:hypothetical protein